MARRVTLDRIEDDVAVLLDGERELHVQRERLPPDAREGDVIDLDSMTVDRDATDRLRDEIRRARARASGNSEPGSGGLDL